MLTARLPVALEAQLNHYAATYGVSKSFVVQEAVQDYLLRSKDKPEPGNVPSKSPAASPLNPVNSLLALGRELAEKYPGVEMDWREARDEGRK